MPTLAFHVSRGFWGLKCSVTSSSNFLLPPDSPSLGCLWPCCALPPAGPGVSPQQVTELSPGSPSCGQELHPIPHTRPQAAKSINVWPDGGGCTSRLELAYILTRDPDSHWNHAKPFITGTPRARAVPRHHRVSSQRASREESLKRLA